MAYTLITGASAGIGYELAKCFYSNGHSLILVARNLNTLNALKAELPENYTKEQYNLLLNKRILLAILETHKESSAKRSFYKNIMFNQDEYTLYKNEQEKIVSFKSSFGINSSFFTHDRGIIIPR